MSSYNNNGAFEQWPNDHNSYGHYSSMSWQPGSVTGSSSSNELHWTNESLRERSVPDGLAPTTSSWSSTTSFNAPSSAEVYGWSLRQGNQYLDRVHPRPSFSALGGNAIELGAGPPTGMGVAAPALQQAFPVSQRAIPASQPLFSPPLNWAQATGPPWQPASTRSRPVYSPGMGAGIPHSQLSASSVTTGQLEHGTMSTGCLPSMAAAPPMQPSTQYNPVTATPIISRTRGERNLPLATDTFQCLWTTGRTQCMAVIAGDRQSVTTHLRNKHEFTCDDQTIACAWSSCTARMQRRSLPRHIVTCHLEIKSTCDRCGMALSRPDARKKHRQACTGTGVSAMMEGGEQDGGRLFF